MSAAPRTSEAQWFDPELRMVYRAPVEYLGHAAAIAGQVQAFPLPSAGKPAPAPARPTKKRKADGCCGVKVQRWLGIRWYGVPWPLRLRLRRHVWPLYVLDLDGCGCIVKIKAGLPIFGHALRTMGTVAWRSFKMWRQL